MGEGEAAFVELLKRLDRCEGPSDVEGVISPKVKESYRQGKGFDITENVWARIGDHLIYRRVTR